MTVQELKAILTEMGSHHFDRSTMRFFGDTIANYGVKETTITDSTGCKVNAYELFRRKPVKHGIRSSTYFDVLTFKRIWNIQKEAS